MLTGIIDLDDPNNVANNNGQMILDWNGQCIHSYNNIVHDLRVNQNNDRIGYATGGILEDNRYYTIGQIRHYDGIFRENEIGNRAHLYSLVDPEVSAPAGRTINNDGANQGWYYGNIIYGQTDLDFHGHHHSAGFFAPESHFHGSLPHVAYMQGIDGACSVSYEDVDESKASGPWQDYPPDGELHVLGLQVIEGPAYEGCLPHHDHGKRWTSVFFNDNLIIDPDGVGLRFEDKNHRADDEQANSENMLELKSPHIHRKWVQMERNVVVGKIFIDILNAAGTDLWTDDWSEVQTEPGIARTVEALAHPGAEVVNSHPYRNDAWLDVNGNDLFVTQGTGLLVRDADDLEGLQFRDNRGFGFPAEIQATIDPHTMLLWLQSSREQQADSVWQQIASWGGSDRGIQALASLHDIRDAFTVEHCGNIARGLDKGFIAVDRIYDDGASIIQACGESDYGTADPAVQITYTPAPMEDGAFSDDLRDLLADTDDFYVSELVLDYVDTVYPQELM